MKVYNQSKLDLNLENAEVVETWQEDCSHIVYDCDLNELLQQWTPACKVTSFVSAKNYLHDKDLFGQRQSVDSYEEMTFLDERVTEVSDRIRQYMQEVILNKTFGDIQRYIILIATELVQNALIYGRIHNELKNVNLKIGISENYVQINVIDNYGSLELSQILGKLKRCVIDGTYEQKREGAGLGLYMISRSCDKMIINVTPGIRTEVNCTINRYQRLKDYKLKNLSFFYIKE